MEPRFYKLTAGDVIRILLFIFVFVPLLLYGLYYGYNYIIAYAEESGYLMEEEPTDSVASTLEEEIQKTMEISGYAEYEIVDVTTNTVLFDDSVIIVYSRSGDQFLLTQMSKESYYEALENNK